MDFSNKVAIVTGGGQGIGKSYVKSLLELGVKVCIAEIAEAIGKQTEKELSEKYKNNVRSVKCDVSDYGSFENAVRQTISFFGKLDILINNAGILNEHSWNKMIEVNMVGTINGIKLAFEYMGKDNGKHGGYVINTASDAGLRPYYMIPVYSSTKYGVVGATKNFGSDYYFEKHGVTVNSICPEPVDTELLKKSGEHSLHPDGCVELLKTATIVSPDTVAKAMIQLLKDGKNGALLHIGQDSTFDYRE